MRHSQRLSIIAFLAICSAVSGCQTVTVVSQTVLDVPQRLAEKMRFRSEIWEQKRLDAEAVHRARLEELVDERETLRLSREALLERRRIERNRDLAVVAAEKEALVAEARAEVEATKPDYREKLETNLGLNFEQQVEVGQLQVDFEELKKRVAKWEEASKKEQLAYEDRMKNWRESQARGGSGKKEGLAANEDCSRPAREKLMDKEALEAPPRMAIAPTEIPLMLPVSLNVRLDNPRIGQSQVRRFPVPKEGLEDCKEPLEDCAPTCQCAECMAKRGGYRQSDGLPPAPPERQATFIPVEESTGRASVGQY